MIVLLATDGPEDTRSLAATLASALDDGDLLVLTGDLGAGKTCFTQGLGAGLGIEDRITSPTFTLANRYVGRLVLNHLDVYRLESVAETMDLGLGELLEDGVTVIEWGDRIEGVLPVEHLVVRLRYPEVTPDDIIGTEADNNDDDDGDNTDGADLDRRIIELVVPDGAGPGVFHRGHDLVDLLAQWSVPSEAAAE